MSKVDPGHTPLSHTSSSPTALAASPTQGGFTVESNQAVHMHGLSPPPLDSRVMAGESLTQFSSVGSLRLPRGWQIVSGNLPSLQSQSVGSSKAKSPSACLLQVEGEMIARSPYTPCAFQDGTLASRTAHRGLGYSGITDPKTDFLPKCRHPDEQGKPLAWGACWPPCARCFLWGSRPRVQSLGVWLSFPSPKG